MTQIRIRKKEVEGFPAELEFDPGWYRRAYNFATSQSTETLRQHYLDVGQDLGHQPSPYFLPKFVRAQLTRLGLDTSGDLRRRYLKHCDVIDPHIHLPRSQVGFRSKIASAGHEDGTWYNFSAYVLRNLDHAETRHSLFFDPTFITNEDGQVVNAPLHHYLMDFENVHRQTTVLFDQSFYTGQSDETAAECLRPNLYLNALDHFLQVGMYRDLAPFSDFDLDHYRRSYPEIEALFGTGAEIDSWVQHFIQRGLFEGRNPNKFFSSEYYIEAQPDVPSEIERLGLTCPFEHFLKIGYKKGLKANQPLHSVAVPELFGKALYEKRCQVTTANVIGNRDKISFPKLSGKPALSCIIPVVDQFHMTIHLLDQLSSICWRRDGPEIEVILVDNGSRDLTRQITDYASNITVERRDAQLGYPIACNIGANAARGDVLLFMNNDIEVSAASVVNGLKALQDRPATGALGGRLIRMHGALQEAGSIVLRDGSSLGVGRDQDPTEPRFNVPREVDYCSGCFLFVQADAFTAIGGFDEAFSPGYYEEADLCARLKETGLNTIYDPSIFAYHYEYASYSKGRPPSASSELMRRNQKRFALHHRKQLSGAASRSGAILNTQIAQSRTQRTVAVIEDFLPDPAFGSGFGRTMDLINSLLDAGCKVSVFVLHYKESAFKEQFKNLGVEIVPSYGFMDVPSIFEGREWDFDVIWVCRTHNFRRMSKDLLQLRSVNAAPRIVFDTEAIAALRDQAFNVLHHLPTLHDLQGQVEQELTGAVDPDVIVTVNVVDRKIATQVSPVPVLELGHKMHIRAAPPKTGKRHGLFFCGSFHDRNSPNYDSLHWFLTEVWPILRQSLPDTKLTIAGYSAPDVDVDALLEPHPGVVYLGKVDDLVPCYDAARCFIAPTRYAGGVPHKVHEAMAMGCPVVCTDLLRRQLMTQDTTVEDVTVLSAGHDDPVAFAAACLHILESDACFDDLQDRAMDFVKANVSDTSFAAQLRDILNVV